MSNIHPTLLRTIDSEIEQCTKELTKFRDKLLEKPSYTFGWADNCVEYAARLDVYRMVRHELTERSTDPFPIDDVISMLTRAAMQEARHPTRSTSQMSNLVAVYITAARIHAIDLLKGFVDD